MLRYEEIYEIVKNKLSEKRFYHSECVVERCIEYAEIYGVDVEKMKIAGIAHDVAKEIPKEERISLAEKYGVELDDIEKINTPLIHAKLGAAIAKKDFGCSDDICEAIKWHTTGKENMSLMEKILFIADATGKDRTYDDAKELYKISKIDLDKAIIKLMQECIKEVIDKESLLHLDSVRAFNYMISNK